MPGLHSLLQRHWPSRYLRGGATIAGALVALAALPGCGDDDCTGDACGDASAAAATATNTVSLTDFSLNAEGPYFINHRIPISFTIAGTKLSDDGDEATEDDTFPVAVEFSFVDAAEADSVEAAGCSSSAIQVAVTPNGEDQVVNAFIWPTSECAALVGRPMTVRVDYDGGDEEAQAELGSVRAESQVLTDSVELTLEATPSGDDGSLIDVVYGLTSESSVALLETAQENVQEAATAPALLVQSSFVVNGRDPYLSGVKEEEIPEEFKNEDPEDAEDIRENLDPEDLAILEQLPGSATLKYTIALASQPEVKRPLAIGEAGENGATGPEVTIQEVSPGLANVFAHELFFEDETRDALLPGGEWAAESNFVVEGCLESAFEQSGSSTDCQSVAVVLVRGSGLPTAASVRRFDRRLDAKVGNSRLSLETFFAANNGLGIGGLDSSVEGQVALRGRLGRSFELIIARGLGEVSVTPAQASYNLSLEAFSKTIFSRSDEREASITREEEASFAKSFTFPALGFGVGPIRLGMDFSVGGEVGITAEDFLGILDDEEECTELLGGETVIPACGSVSRTVTPFFAMTGRVFGGFRSRRFRAGVEARLRVAETSFPLTAALAFGITEDDGVLINGTANWTREFRLLSGNVAAIAKIRVFRRWRTLVRVNILRFSTRTQRGTLMSKSLGTPELLEAL